MRIARIAGVACSGAVLAGLLATGPVSCSGTEIPDPDEALYGTVKSQRGAPVAGARVIAWAQADVMAKAQAGEAQARTKDTVTTDAYGFYAFKDTLAEGKYNLYFEDTSGDIRNRTVGFEKNVDYGTSRRVSVAAKLAPPGQLDLTVKEYREGAAIEGADCRIEESPYGKLTGEDGIAVFFLSEGRYSVRCIYAPPHVTRLENVFTEIEVKSGVESQETLILYPDGVRPNPLPPPDSLSVRYDENSGVAHLTWPSVNDSRLLNYGIGRVNIDSGGGATEQAVFLNYFDDAVFGPDDSVQVKNLKYSVSSRKSNLADNAGSRRTYADLRALRPWAYGARIDSVIPLPKEGGYRAGDTIRFAAFWNNRINGNDSLFWWVQGGADLKESRAHPPAKGSDTLSVVLPAEGEYRINLSIHDAEGYRSWLAIPFRL